MNGAESLVRTLVDSRRRGLLLKSRHIGNAFRRRTRQGRRHAGGAGPVRGRGDRHGGRLWPHGAKSRPARLLHLGPGLANGLANLHNARRAATPIVNIVGNHATYHAQYRLRRSPRTSWALRGRCQVGSTLRPAPIQKPSPPTARAPCRPRCNTPGQIATLILPADTAWVEADRAAPPLPKPAPAKASFEAIDQAAAALRSGRKTLILIRGAALKERGLHAAGRIAAATGTRIACDTFAPRCRRGAGRRLDRTHSLFRRADRAVHAGNRATHPGRRETPCEFLCLPWQAFLVHAGGLPHPVSRARA